MKRVVQFSKLYVPAAIFSLSLIALGLIGYFVMGFNLGVDFQAGINQTVQLAYPALNVTYEGRGNVTMSVDTDKLTIVFSGAEIENKTVVIDYAKTPALSDLATAISANPGLAVAIVDQPATETKLLVPTFQGDTRLGPEPFVMHRAPANDSESFSTIEKVRESLKGQGDISVQQVRPISLQRYLIRVQDKGKEAGFSQSAPALIRTSLEKTFGTSRVVVMKTDYVGARYSQSLTKTSAILILATVLVILLYATLRFGFQYGMGAVLATLHDALVMVCFVVWTRMEFNTSTIAAILTILGYSINDTIVQFDRVREERKLRPTEKFNDVLNSALTITLSRTVITTLCTMLTVVALIIFTTGSIQDFAIALFVGMISGTYSTLYIASAFVLWWEDRKEKRVLLERTHSKDKIPALQPK
jgi:preprotein translocase subunit SecF